MKNIRKVLSLLVAVVMGFALAVPAFAEENTSKYSITIKHNENDSSKHSYNLYQVFSASSVLEENNNKVLGDIDWGKQLEGHEISIKTTVGLNDKASAQDVAKNISEDAESLKKFNTALESLFGNSESGITPMASKNTTDDINTNKEIVFSDLEPGYYFILDTEANSANVGAPHSKYIVDVVGDTEVYTKSDFPDLDKKIIPGTDTTNLTPEDHIKEGKYSVASIGETIHYQLNTYVPNLNNESDYTGYIFKVTDILSKGLTFSKDTVVIKVGAGSTEQTLVAGTDYVVSELEDVKDKDTNENTGQKKFTITFQNLNSYKDQPIVINYDAVVNNEAERGSNPNTNEAYLTYGKETEADTAHKYTHTYVTDFKLKKVDDNLNPLEGAQFSLTATGNAKLPVFTTTMEGDPKVETVKSESGVEETVIKWNESVGEGKWEPKEYAAKKEVSTNGKKAIACFNGLGAGTYTIKETKVPAGYNKAADFTLTIGFNINTAETNPANAITWTYAINGVATTQNINEYELINNKGLTLPSTGGMGTTLFIGGGAALMAIAGALLIMKKRNAAED